jgi:hypothetical protein
MNLCSTLLPDDQGAGIFNPAKNPSSSFSFKSQLNKKLKQYVKYIREKNYFHRP